jgi:hypothetical protein
MKIITEKVEKKKVEIFKLKNKLIMWFNKDEFEKELNSII